ncbi:Nitrilotriacetate monooxygenase component B [Klebsiella pneumoniae IS10]|nr:Nitrilotriacetate monooxygenase component B [Klebsiella pneumoniae IS10]
MTISFEQPRKIPVDGGAVNKGVWISPLSVTGAACTFINLRRATACRMTR